jgi:hypothetical protein
MKRLLAPILTFVARLRYRTLFLVAAGLFALDLIIPDAIPLVDEILLGIATIVLARLRKSGDGSEKNPPPSDPSPPGLPRREQASGSRVVESASRDRLPRQGLTCASQ